MLAVSTHRALLIAALVGFVAHFAAAAHAQAPLQTVSIFIVRHAETDGSQPTIPLSAVGRQRAELLAPTLNGVTFTHLFATHTTRTRQMLEAIAAKHGLQIVQLPVPGSVLDGQPVTDQTSRRAPIEPVAEALLKLPPGSIALAALNSENIYAILNRLGVPVAEPGKPCVAGRNVCTVPRQQMFSPGVRPYVACRSRARARDTARFRRVAVRRGLARV